MSCKCPAWLREVNDELEEHGLPTVHYDACPQHDSATCSVCTPTQYQVAEVG